MWLLHVTSLVCHNMSLKVLECLTLCDWLLQEQKDRSCQVFLIRRFQKRGSLPRYSIDQNCHPRASPLARGIDSTSCWGSGEVTLLTRIGAGKYCRGHLWTTESVTPSMCERKVGIDAPRGHP